MVYNLSFLILIYPVSYAEDKWGPRWVLIIASICQCLGTWIKYLATSPDGYVLTLIGQSLVGAWQILILSMPPSLAALWFGHDQINTATALGYAGMVAGVSVSSVITPIVVKDNEDRQVISENLRQLNLTLAIYCSLVVILVVLCKLNLIHFHGNALLSEL